MEQSDLIFNPNNDKNIEITEEEVNSILSNYGLPSKVHNLKLYQRAFIHRSYVKKPQAENEKNHVILVDRPDNCMPLKTKSNERLEFLGDGVLECITKYYLYKRFPKEQEGFMTEKKIALVKNEHIGKLALEMGLHKWFVLSKHSEEKNTRTNVKKLGCLFEAFIGALFLDFNKITIYDEDEWFKDVFTTGPGFQMAQIFVENILERHVNWSDLVKVDDNYKNILQVRIQKEFKVTPEYLIVEHSDDVGFTMGVYLNVNTPVQDIKPRNAITMEKPYNMHRIHKYIEDNGSILLCLETATHKVKKKAEQIACENALLSL
jgi:dsRNA-specific ribonuclease